MGDHKFGRFLSGLGAILSGVGLFLLMLGVAAALTVGWWFVGQHTDSLPGPVRGAVQALWFNGGVGIGTAPPVLDVPVSATPECLAYMADLAKLKDSLAGIVSPDALRQSKANNAVIERELKRLVRAGTPTDLSRGPVAAALHDQALTWRVIGGRVKNLRPSTRRGMEEAAIFSAASATVVVANDNLLSNVSAGVPEWRTWGAAILPVQPSAMRAALGPIGTCP